ncbi:hypothetical protein ACOMHN_059026 [Nucella lapillus]
MSKMEEGDLPQGMREAVKKIAGPQKEDKGENEALMHEIANETSKKEMAEFRDRTRRATNLVVFRLEEDTSKGKENGQTKDEESVQKLLGEIKGTHQPTEIRRLGKLFSGKEKDEAPQEEKDAGNQRTESHVPASSVQTASSQSSGPCVSVPPPSNCSGRDQRMAADADIRTVMVTGPSLGKDQEDLCELYFKNKKRSDGGDISEKGIVWNEEQKCFFITFMESHVAKRVASKEHSLKGCPVQVQLWSPERFSSGQSAVEMQKNRVLVSGFPPGTTSDLLQNYLECLLTVEVDSVKVNGNDRSALIIFEAPIEKIDVEEMERTCQSSPLEEGVSLSFRGVAVSSQKAPATSTVQVEGLKPETVNETVEYFFGNTIRNAGGPVKEVVRIGATTALVHFENAEDRDSGHHPRQSPHPPALQGHGKKPGQGLVTSSQALLTWQGTLRPFTPHLVGEALQQTNIPAQQVHRYDMEVRVMVLLFSPGLPTVALQTRAHFQTHKLAGVLSLKPVWLLVWGGTGSHSPLVWEGTGSHNPLVWEGTGSHNPLVWEGTGSHSPLVRERTSSHSQLTIIRLVQLAVT